jgi:UDP-N-acetylmuramate--alanine ligase
VTGQLIVDAVLDAHPTARVVWLPRREDLVSFLAGEVGGGDVCISMGCGDVASLPDEVLARRRERRST